LAEKKCVKEAQRQQTQDLPPLKHYVFKSKHFDDYPELKDWSCLNALLQLMHVKSLHQIME
jgi:hypothetical protein